MTDNRTNHEIVAQVLEEHGKAYEHGVLPTGFMEDQILRELRAAGRLVAAQGAAPQAESEPKPHTRVVTRSFDSDCALGICLSGCSHLMWVCDSCSSEGGWGAARGQLKKWAAEHVCPVLPSSGVDEEKLAEVIEAHVLGEPNGGTASWARVNCSCGHRIEIAGVTRERVVALGRMHQARAVAEWLKGQGRGSEM